MIFEQFINKCLSAIKNSHISKDAVYFQYIYYPDEPTVSNTYMFRIRGTNYKVYITPNEEVCQVYDKNNEFKNMKSLKDCLDEFLKNLEVFEYEI